jgi:hypothetical protein
MTIKNFQRSTDKQVVTEEFKFAINAVYTSTTVKAPTISNCTHLMQSQNQTHCGIYIRNSISWTDQARSGTDSPNAAITLPANRNIQSRPKDNFELCLQLC